MEQKQVNRDVESWWDRNPFNFGVANEDRDQVGAIDPEKMDLRYFTEIERRFRKHSRGGAQEDGAPLFSKLIDYSWLKGKRGLDIAVGSGFSLVALTRAGARMTGIDITDYAVTHARRNLEVQHLSADVEKMDAQHMRFDDDTFDFVNAWGCLMHMPETERAVSEIHRVLKPSGRVLAYMYNRSSWPFWFNLVFLRGILMGKLFYYRGDFTRLSSRYSDGYSRGGNPLTKFYTPNEVEQMFRNAGFRNVRAYPWDLPEEPNHWPLRSFPIFKYLPKVVRRFLSKRFGYGLIVQAEK